jgi:hypothetical protein
MTAMLLLLSGVLVKLQNQYKDFLSDFKAGIKTTCERLAYFPENIGKRLSIDETSLSNGELYTILTNKAAKGKRIYSSNDCWH